MELDLDNDELENLLNDLPETDDILDYFQMLDGDIPTEDYLTEEQIINLVQVEEKEESDDDDDDDDEEIPPVSAKKAVDGLKTFISFFEQQNDHKFNVDDLHFFRKYLQIVKLKEINSKKQSMLDVFFNDCGM